MTTMAAFASRTGVREAGYSGGTVRTRAQVSKVFADCMQAYEALGEIGELAENLRILSLNAELAAGRAGEKGRAVRVLTQYTRELVNRLAQVHVDLSKIRGTVYRCATDALQILLRLGYYEEGRTRGPESAQAALRVAYDRGLSALGGHVESLLRALEALDRQTRYIGEVVSQSDSIATNIAIEAVTAGVHEQEFNQVAGTMRRYVEELKTMIENAGHAVREAANASEALRMRGSRRAQP